MNSGAKEIFLDKIKDFQFNYEKIDKRRNLREEFTKNFSKKRISSLKPEDYFPGLGKKKGCMGYELEYATRELGSISGGSIIKYGPKEQFNEIKEIIENLLNFEDDRSYFYKDNGELTSEIQNIIIKY